MTLPWGSVIVTIVLLNVLLMCAAPCGCSSFPGGASSAPSWGQQRLPSSRVASSYLAFFLPDGALGALTGTRVGLGALATHRQATAVPQALVAADLDLAANVGLHLAAQVTLDLEVGFDVVAQVGQLVVGQVLGAQVPVNAGGCQDLVGSGTSDAEDVRQRDLHPLIARQIDAY